MFDMNTLRDENFWGTNNIYLRFLPYFPDTKMAQVNETLPPEGPGSAVDI